MPTRGQTIIQALQTGLPPTKAATVAGLGIGAVGSTVIGLALAPVVAGLAADLTRVRFPRLPPVSSILGQTRALRRRGLQPVISSGPLTGNVVISTQDQARFLPELVQNAEVRQLLAPFIPKFSDELRAIRDTRIEEGRRRGRGLSFSSSLRGGVTRETADSPLTFVEGNFLA